VTGFTFCFRSFGKGESPGQLNVAFAGCGGLAVEGWAAVGACALSPGVDALMLRRSKSLSVLAYKQNSRLLRMAESAPFLYVCVDSVVQCCAGANGQVDEKEYRGPGPASSGRAHRVRVSDLGVIGKISPHLPYQFPVRMAELYEASLFNLGCVGVPVCLNISMSRLGNCSRVWRVLSSIRSMS